MGKESISNKTFVKGLAAGVVIAASLGILQAGEYSVNPANTNASPEGQNQGTGSYTAGTYTATATGMSEVVVTVTFDETSITDITVDVSGETPGIGADIGDEMAEKFLTAQSSEVDGITGATITSDALKAAVADCIAQASSGNAETTSPELSEDEEAESAAVDTNGSEADEKEEAVSETGLTENAETQAEPQSDISENAEKETAVPADTAEVPETDDAAGQSETEEAAKAVSSAAADGYAPGTYTASAKGISNDITVTVTFDETDILDITADVSGETAGIGTEAAEPMILRILDAQSTDVDSISGATVTSDALKAAVADCMLQAAEVKNTAAEPNVPAEEFTPGTYTAAAAGISSDITVTVTFDENGIAAISADVSGETTGLGTEVDEPMILRILDAQSVNVDSISGATITSDALKAAVADCMLQAGFDDNGGTADTSLETEDITEASPETEDSTEASLETEDSTEASPETEDSTEASPETEDSTEASPETEDSTETSPARYVPGTYTAAAQGISSEITVTAIFDENSILSMDADVSGETAGIGAMIDTDICNDIMEAQSADVDSISGATITSNAILAAAADCINQAALTDGEKDQEVSQPAADAPFVPGTYTAAAQGISSEITVTAIFDENSILSMDADVSGETAGIGAMIDTDICNDIMEAQSADVDGISGATITSDAIRAAAADCISQARIADDAEE